MIPPEVSAIASLIFAEWADTDDLTCNEVLESAWRIYNAGYRRAPQANNGTENKGYRQP